jgi:hypothetical protein
VGEGARLMDKIFSLAGKPGWYPGRIPTFDTIGS